MARRIHEPTEGPALDTDRARSWLEIARGSVRRATENEAAFRAGMKLSGEVLEIWKRGEEEGRLPEAIERARKLLLARGEGRVIERADARCDDPAQVPSARHVGALLGLRVRA
jgi:hypothetical protein